MTVRVIWSPAALRQVARIFDYLADFNPLAAAAVADALITAGDGFAHSPRRGRAVPGSHLRELVTAYPYVIRFRIVHDTVRILRVRHTSQRPTEP